MNSTAKLDTRLVWFGSVHSFFSAGLLFDYIGSHSASIAMDSLFLFSMLFWMLYAGCRAMAKEFRCTFMNIFYTFKYCRSGNDAEYFNPEYFNSFLKPFTDHADEVHKMAIPIRKMWKLKTKWTGFFGCCCHCIRWQKWLKWFWATVEMASVFVA